jgi:hypothetical protein
MPSTRRRQRRNAWPTSGRNRSRAQRSAISGNGFSRLGRCFLGRPPSTVGLGTGGVGAGPNEAVVHWTVDRIKGRQHMLKNLGRSEAYDVILTAENVVRCDAPERQYVREMGGTLALPLASAPCRPGRPCSSSAGVTHPMTTSVSSAGLCPDAGITEP